MREISPVRKYLQLLTALLTLAFASCSFNNLSGTSSGVETKVARGSIVHEDGSAAAHARVYLIPADYDPEKDAPLPKSSSGVTGVNGEYELSENDTGNFNIQAVLDDNGSRLLIRGVHLTGDITSIPKGILRAPGAIKVIFPDNIDTANGYLYLPGTDIAISLRGKTGSATLDSVPAGELPPVHYALRNVTGMSRALTGEVIVQPGATETIAYNEWPYSQRIRINTTSSGAGVSSNQYDFPLLIRLTDSNFAFNQAKSGGEDIRFAKSDNTPLPFEIERWDANAGKAEIWVRIDTVYGNDTTQSIIMYWGNPNASGVSNGGAVFDTSNGFQDVWHLNQKCDDVTYSGNNGTNYGTTDTTGIIGYCKKFDGSDSIKIAGLLGSPASITLSAWAQLDSVSGGKGGEILSIGDAVLIRMDFSVLNEGTMGAIHPYGDSVFDVVTTSQFLKQTGWHLITFTVDQDNHSQTLYIDGSAVRSESNVISIDYSKVGQNTFIGTHGNGTAGYNFSGRIDEVRIYRKSISADYVKLSFMNQRQDDRLVTIK